MGDIDILVKKTDLLKAEKILLELGYTSSREDDIEAICARDQHIPALFKQDTSPVEIHWTLESQSYPLTVDTEALWMRAIPEKVAGIEVLVLSPEDLLLHLCLHTVFHHFYKDALKALCDIRETVLHYRGEIKWETVRRRSQLWGAENPVFLTLYYAKQLLSANIPDDALEKIQPENFTPMMAAESEEFIFNILSGINPAGGYVAQLCNTESVREGIQLIIKRIIPSRKEIARKYHISQGSRQIYLYYLAHLADFFVRHTRTFWRLFRKDQSYKQKMESVNRQLDITNWVFHVSKNEEGRLQGRGKRKYGPGALI
jgi:hypothetical protein